MRTIGVSKSASGYTVSVTLPENATRWDVSAALVELNRLTPFIEEGCPGCGVSNGAPGALPGERNGARVHALGCPQGPADLLERLRVEAGLKPSAPPLDPSNRG